MKIFITTSIIAFCACCLIPKKIKHHKQIINNRLKNERDFFNKVNSKNYKG